MGSWQSTRRKKGQVSLEYLTVIGISLLMVFPLTLIFIQQTENFKEDIKATHLEKLSNELIDAAEEVFYLGPPTQKRITLYFPETLKYINISPQYIEFNIVYGSSERSFYVDSGLPLNMSGSLETFPGPHTILVSSQSSGIVINDVS